MRSFIHNRSLDALVKTLLAYAIIHVLTMTIYALVTGEYTILNAFRVLGFTLFFPGIDHGIDSFVISFFLYGVIFGIVYFAFTKKP